MAHGRLEMDEGKGGEVHGATEDETEQEGWVIA